MTAKMVCPNCGAITPIANRDCERCYGSINFGGKRGQKIAFLVVVATIATIVAFGYFTQP